MADDGALQFVQEPVHDLGRAKRLVAIPELGEHGMPVPEPNREIDDMNVPQFGFEHLRAEFDAVEESAARHSAGGIVSAWIWKLRFGIAGLLVRVYAFISAGKPGTRRSCSVIGT